MKKIQIEFPSYLMFLFSLYTFFAFSSQKYDFVTSGLPQMYTFDCKDRATFRYMPLEGYKLVIRSNMAVTCNRSSLTDFENYEFPLNLEQKDDYFQSERISLEVEPADIICRCQTSEGFGAISPIVVQSVTSDTGIITMGIISIIFVLIDISIVGVQFCTFHHRKSD